jgi:hypothetical protein
VGVLKHPNLVWFVLREVHVVHSGNVGLLAIKSSDAVLLFPTFIKLLRLIMNRKKIALLLACGVCMGLSAISGSSAADSSTRKPAISKPFAHPKAHEKDHCDEHGSGMMGGYGRGMMRNHGGGMMEGYGSGMMMESPRMHMVMSLDLSDEQRSKIIGQYKVLSRTNRQSFAIFMKQTNVIHRRLAMYTKRFLT